MLWWFLRFQTITCPNKVKYSSIWHGASNSNQLLEIYQKLWLCLVDNGNLSSDWLYVMCFCRRVFGQSLKSYQASSWAAQGPQSCHSRSWWDQTKNGRHGPERYAPHTIVNYNGHVCVYMSVNTPHGCYGIVLTFELVQEPVIPF